ncbi:MAG: DUF3179 domain-containing protein [Thaumarchaeota archaeon]|nr:DUF3179 domain-containing protein [Nitrososphaerota archaeon]
MLDKLLAVAVILTLVAAGAFAYFSYSQVPTGLGEVSSNQVVPADQIVSGGPPPDGIPSIDNPRFVTATNASSWLNDDYDTVIGVSLKGDARAYPLQILVWHEIVNDVIGGVPVAITYCPLCYSTQAFVRQINGTAVQFGTSGKLYNNNLVMYDRLTDSLWSQFWGQAIAGSLTGHRLQRVPIDVTTWGAWKKLYPNTMVLSRQTGFSRDYGNDPYGVYYFTKGIYFPLAHLDTRLPQKTMVLGLTIGAASRAYISDSPFGQGALAYKLTNLTSPISMDSVGGTPVLVWEDGQIVRFYSPVVNGNLLTFVNSNGTVVDSETHSVWNFGGVAISGPLMGQSMTRYVSETAFWFAWAAFYPNTTIYPSQ